MLQTPAGSPGVKLFILNVQFFQQWAWEQRILRTLRLEEILEMFLASDWESRLWLAVYRSQVERLSTNDTVTYLRQFIATHHQEFLSYRVFLLKTIENLTLLSLEGQEVVFQRWIDIASVLIQVQPCNTATLKEFTSELGLTTLVLK